MNGSKDYCAFCNLTFALVQTQITYRGQLYHGDCFVKKLAEQKTVKTAEVSHLVQEEVKHESRIN